MNSLMVAQLGDIDIDTKDRSELLADLAHVPAVIERNGEFVKHNTGVYFHQVPVNPFMRWCSLHYQKAEKQGCYKIDVLNNSIYNMVRDETHLNQLMETEPMWDLLAHEEVVKELAHVNQHWELVKMLQPRSVIELAMLLALIRPAKRHLVKRCAQQGWHSIDNEIWTSDGSSYHFKKSHSISLAWTIVIQLNLMVETIAIS
jgi:hypothetical protein